MKQKLVTVYKPYQRFDGTVEKASVNWSAIGSVDPATAREFAEELLAACDEAEKLNEEFGVDSNEV